MIRPCLAVDKLNAETAIKNARIQGLLDRNFQIEQKGDIVYIPIFGAIQGSATHDFRDRKNSINRIVEELSDSGISNSEISYIRLGNSLIFRHIISEKTAKIFSSLPGIKNIYSETGKIRGIKRRPSLKLVYGPGGETRVMEYGITYIMNLQKVMFSPGNINTRSKMRSIDVSGSIVIDMFCGIGYFSLPLIKNSVPSRMICCDINHDSIYYFKRNIIENRIIYPVEVLTGDSRAILPFVIADYIIMGNFNSPEFLCTALIRSHQGTRISMHYLATVDSIEPDGMHIIDMARKMGFLIKCIYSAKVKSVGPKYVHVNSIFTVVRII